tara:strand:+ start:118 stop:690 length:573 start_codon:yes stop_codon:yes gene_type:complete
MRESFKKYLMKNYHIDDITYFDKIVHNKFPIPNFVKAMEMDVSERKMISLYNKTQNTKKIKLYNLKNQIFDSEEKLEKTIKEINTLDYVGKYKDDVSENRKNIVFKLDERRYYMSHRQYTKYIHNIKYSFYNYISELWEIELSYALKEYYSSDRIIEPETYEVEVEIMNELDEMTDYSDTESTCSDDNTI